MSTTGNGSVTIPASVVAEIDAAAAQQGAVSTGQQITPAPGGVPGGVSAIPIDAATWIQISCPANPSLAGYASTLSVSMTARILLPDGTLNYSRWDLSWSPTTGLVYQSDMAPGYLLSVTTTCNSPGILDGMLYVTVGLVHQNTVGVPLDTALIAGYLSTLSVLGWPGGVLRPVLEGPGFCLQVSPGNPAAGVALTYSVVDQYVQLYSVTMTLTTGSTAANRYPYIALIPPVGRVVDLGYWPYAQVASTASSYYFGIGENVPSTTVTNYIATTPLVASSVLSVGSTIRVGTLNLQSTDQISAVRMGMNAWL